MMGFDAQVDTERALAVEIAENEHRHDYTPAEVRMLASRLREAGYVDLKGRSAKGQKTLRPALGVIVGKNLSTIRRYLNQDEDEKSRSPERLSDTREDLRKAKNLLTRWANKTASEQKTTAELKEGVGNPILKSRGFDIDVLCVGYASPHNFFSFSMSLDRGFKPTGSRVFSF